jgi:putative ABC transport system permease protein
LALRDLARYQARSGAALGAATLAVAIAATIAVSAAAAEAPHTTSNLPANQLILHVSSGYIGDPIPVLTPAQQDALRAPVDELASTLHAGTVLPIEEAYNPRAPIQPPPPGLGGPSGGQATAALAHVHVHGQGEEINPVVQLYVATPALLSHYGIKPTQINPTADVISSRSDIGGLQIFLPILGPGGPGGPKGVRPQQPRVVTNPHIQVLKQLPTYTSDPSTLLTVHGMRALGLEPTPAGWLIETPHPLTTAQVATARHTAASAGLFVETKSAQKTLAPLRNWSTAAGILVALGVLAMTVGLIRSETANDLRTLTATGASSTTRRTLTGATAGALALLGALLGTAGAYAALLAWHRSNLDPLTRVPIVNLVIIMAALPVVATLGGWLLAGREPPAIARRPLE